MQVSWLPDGQTDRISTHTGVGLWEILLDFEQSRERPKEKLQKKKWNEKVTLKIEINIAFT